MQRKNKRQSRVVALHLLFSMEMIHGKIERNLSVCMDFHKKTAVEVREYAEFLVEGVSENIASIDEMIRIYCKNWDITRVAMIDLNILRIGVFELIFCGDIPAAVVINEAIEIAKIYGSDDSAGFINGIMDNVRKRVREESS
ncbi:MAG: transcription antitermination factor NusB [bacterium]|nr:transcription antitermination factor NusB [bacterium]